MINSNIKESDKNISKQKVADFLLGNFNQVIIFIVIIIIGSGFLFLLYPKYKQINNFNQSKIKILQAEYESKQKYLKALNEMKTAYSQIDPTLIAKIEAMAPKQAEVEKLISELEAVTIKNGLILSSLQIDNSQIKNQTEVKANLEPNRTTTADTLIISGLSQIKIALKVVGTDYYGLKNILRTIENNLRIMDINKIAYDDAKSETSLEIIVYYLP